MAQRVTCVLMGDQSLLVECGESLIDRGHDVLCVATSSEPVRQWAIGRSIPVVEPGSKLTADLECYEYDWFFSIANLRIVPEPVWRAARQGAANFHDGPLPRYAGLNTPTWAILQGETDYGVSWHALSTGIDEGDIYKTAPIEIVADDTALTLNTKCFAAGIESFLELIAAIETGNLQGETQDFSQRKYFSKTARPEASATIDFSAPTDAIKRLGRALSFGDRYVNPVALPKVRVDGRAYNVGAIEPVIVTTLASPGSIVSVDVEGAVIAAADGTVRLSSLTDASGQSIKADRILQPTKKIDPLTPAEITALAELFGDVARDEDFFVRRITRARRLELPGLNTAPDHTNPIWDTLDFELPSGLTGARAVATIAAYLHRVSGAGAFDVAYCDDCLAERASKAPGYIMASVPLAVSSGSDVRVDGFFDTIDNEITKLKKRSAVAGDLISRLAGEPYAPPSVGIRLTVNPTADGAVDGASVTFVVSKDTGHAKIIFDSARFSRAEAEATKQRIESLAWAMTNAPQQLVGELPLMSDATAQQLLVARNATTCDFDQAAVVHSLIEMQVDRTPDAVAIVSGNREMTYRQLDAAANRLAHHLTGLGVQPDQCVGIYLSRSCDLVIGALAIMKAGAAYVPLDPSYPVNRIELMIEDSGLKVIVSEQGLAPPIGNTGSRIVRIDDEHLAAEIETRPGKTAIPENLAYVIYTSGSTGRPKGVMVEHRNAVNFFRGMDDRITLPAGRQPTWLAVTSLSFDISVLELFWTLTRGFKVVVFSDDRPQADPGKSISGSRSPAPSDATCGFGLFYWGNDDGPGSQKYRLLLEGAKFADANGFTSIWTPERHFHAFGGPYPNPAVTGAAVAAVTKNISIRAGSCVLPLHHPARVAEDWAIIDNISDGRVGIGIASGWMPEDFVLRPQNAPPNNKTSMFRDIEILRRLWRGESVAFTGANDKLIKVATLPRPVQPELPIWVTIAGNDETFRQAGQIGANVLTHLLGQSIDEVAGKIKVYRNALIESGRDPREYKVTLMLHTLVGSDRDAVRELAREPMKSYLMSAAALIKQYAWAFPAFKRPKGLAQPVDLDLETLDPEEIDAIIEFAFQRYFDDSGLFGTVEDAIARTEQLIQIGVDEIACLIDYGLPQEAVLEGLKPLAEVVRAFGATQTIDTVAVTADTAPAVASPLPPMSFADLVVAHGVTHLQCTPSMATTLLLNDENRGVLDRLDMIMLGGEALPGTMVADLRSATAARIENMYGPTETTIWSSTGPATEGDGTVPLGTPIANTQLYVLDDALRPVPPGVPGELFIGGDGVTRGYFGRDDLTAERFLSNPFIKDGRIYRTGDLVQFDHEGALRFIGRTDHQVKVRGYRIELSEIETALRSLSSVREAVAIVREDTPGDVRIVAYLRHGDTTSTDAELREHLAATIPDFMIPAHFVAMDTFPLTPNAKIDRKALPRPNAIAKTAIEAEYVAPASDVEITIADGFKRVLGIEKVGANDNFFMLGGHSLLAVQLHRYLKSAIGSKVAITDIYRFPIVADLAGYLRDGEKSDPGLGRAASRAARRRTALASRRPGAA